MPPKAKFLKEEIVSAAFEIVRKDGMGALTARGLAAKLGSSARPIFTVFNGMDEVAGEVIAAVKKLYDSYVARGLEEELPFKGVGRNYILFAIDEPKLFQLLFMSESKDDPNVDSILAYVEDNYEKIVPTVEKEYNFSRELALRLYRHLWIYTHGIATLCATRVCNFTAEQISQMLTDVFVGIYRKLKEEQE